MRGTLVAASGILLAAGLSGQTQTPTATPTETVPPWMYLSTPTPAHIATNRFQQRASVATGADGHTLIVFHSDPTPGYFDIMGRLFDPNGIPDGPEFQIDQAAADHIAFTPEAIALANGNYVVVWADFNQTVTDSEVQTRLLDQTGTPVGGQVQVNTFTTGLQSLPRLASRPGGEVAFTWQSAGADGDGYGIAARFTDAGGAFTGPETVVNTSTAGDQTRAAVAGNADGWIFSWQDSVGVRARQYSGSNVPGPQYDVFGADHDLPDVAWGNTPLYISRNTTQNTISGRRGTDGNLGNEFTIHRGSSQEQVAFARICKAIHDYGNGVTWDSFNPDSNAYRAEMQSLEETPNGLSELYKPFLVFPDAPGAWTPACASGSDGKVFWAGQTSNGADDDVQYRFGGRPRAAQLLFGDGSTRFVTAGFSYNAWMSLYNAGSQAKALDGVLTGNQFLLRSPDAPSALVINDDTADYGSVAPGAFTDCTTTGDCYNITINEPRPALDWDESVTESLNTGISKTWLVHVAESFPDVTIANPFIEFVETLLHNGVTAGGACGGYCPTDGVKRQQMAVFLLKSRFGRDFTPPPATGTVFADVPLSNPFAAWIEALYLLNVTGGCATNPLQYCPDAIVNRQQMAVFLLKTKEGSSYDPPDCAGIFTDVPCTPGTGFSDWIEELYNRQITGGCATNPLQYCPTNPTNRQQMAAFLVKNFGLILYGP